MYIASAEISQDIQWKLNIVQRNLQLSNWIDLMPEAQAQMLKEVILLSEELPLSVYQSLISALSKLLEHSSTHLQSEIQAMVSNTPIYKIQQPLNIFVRQPFTESGNRQKNIVQGALDILTQIDQQHHALNLLTGTEAQSQTTFRHAFEQQTGQRFTPSNFRQHRLQLLNEADAMIIIRTSLSESGAFEVAYNAFGGKKIPMFFAVWQQTPIKTTLLRDLNELCHATYVTFENPEELITPLLDFLTTVPYHSQAPSYHYHAA